MKFCFNLIYLTVSILRNINKLFIHVTILINILGIVLFLHDNHIYSCKWIVHIEKITRCWTKLHLAQ